MIRVAAVFLAMLAGCNAGEDVEASRVELGAISVSPPARWEMEERGSTTRVWTPEENPRRESVTVVIGPRFLGGAERAFAQARTAQGVLRDVRISGSERVSSRAGLPGLRLDLQFRPDSLMSEVHHRSHAVLFVEDDAGDYTVHVIYTAAEPDPSRAAFGRVLASIEKGV